MTARRYGYGRVSTRDQSHDAQRDALVAAGVDERYIYVEKASTRLALRPELEKLRAQLRSGDTIVVTKLDRLGRSVMDLITIANDLADNGVTLEILSGSFNRDDPMGKAFFVIASAFAELERDLVRARTLDGLAAARARGRKGGRKPKLSAAQAAEVKRLYDAKDKTVAEIGALFGITRESVYRYVNPKDDQPAKSGSKAVKAKPAR
jgi:DNA invertase Pin-like site-specific DNA recombinase